MGLDGGGVEEVGGVGVSGVSGVGLEEPKHWGLQETQLTVHSSGQNLGQTCSKL